MKQVKATIVFEAGDLQNKSWNDILDEALADLKSEKLKELEACPVPGKNLFINFLITYND